MTKRKACVILLAILAALACGRFAMFAHERLSRYGVANIRFFPPDIGFYSPPADANPLPLPEPVPVRSVVLLVGDGMGLGTMFLSVMAGGDPAGRLHMETMPVVGLVRTHSGDSLHTDSGASATALATGRKTHNNMLAILPDGTPVKTVLELARESAMRTGVVVTCSIADETPAAFLIHGDSGEGEGAIAEKVSAALPDILLGRGPAVWREEGSKGEERFLSAASRQGYAIVRTGKELAEAEAPPLVGLFDGESAMPTLPEMTGRALQALSGGGNAEKGFFLLIEGSFIDKFAHANDTGAVIRETLWFDLAVKEALDFAQRNPGTLVIVTADHDTGGIAFPAISHYAYVSWTSRSHTALPVPLFAYGPGAERFGGVNDNTDIGRRIMAALGFHASE